MPSEMSQGRFHSLVSLFYTLILFLIFVALIAWALRPLFEFLEHRSYKQRRKLDFAVTIERAEAGDMYSQLDAGMEYDFGVGAVDKDEKLAVLWYRKAAEQGHPLAQYHLGRLFEEGKGVERDYSQAFTWYRKSADKGYSGSQFRLAEFYLDGRGVQSDVSLGIQWLRKAVAQGDPESIFRLGLCFYEGLGVGKDWTEAYALVSISLNFDPRNLFPALKFKGDDKFTRGVKSTLARWELEMSASQLELARRRAKEIEKEIKAR